MTRLLECIVADVLPLTEHGVAGGSKVFGAALLDRDTLGTVLAATNNEIESPLHHGEMHLLKRYHEWPAAHRPDPSTMVFLSTHEPCTMCASAIAWSGFDTVHYLFSHEESRDAFAIPHDLAIMKALYDVEPGQYRRHNDYFHATGIRELAAALPDADRSDAERRIAAIEERYATLSLHYQRDKATNRIPLN